MYAGDLFDRGDYTLDVIDFVCEMLSKNRALLVRGNHEDLFLDLLKKSDFDYYDQTNGTLKTLAAVNKPQVTEFDATVNFNSCASLNNIDTRIFDIINSEKDYIELGDYIFVHGWIPLTKSELSIRDDWRHDKEAYWKKARWINGMEAAFKGHILEGKTIVCGHWHTSYGHVHSMGEEKILELMKAEYPNSPMVENRDDFAYSFAYEMFSNKLLKKLEFADGADFSIYRGKGIIALDACTAWTGKVNVLVLEETETGEIKESQ